MVRDFIILYTDSTGEEGEEPDESVTDADFFALAEAARGIGDCDFFDAYRSR